MKKRFGLAVLLASVFFVSPPFTLAFHSDNDGSPKKPEKRKTVSLAEPSPLSDGMYSLSIPSSIGTLTYYNQNDIRWADFLYGKKDPLSVYGCGPTVLAMLVSSFTDTDVTPDKMAKWAYEHHYWRSGSGSVHSLIPEGAAAFGFSAASLPGLTEEHMIEALNNNSILVALMGPGHFTDSGHFIIIADYWSGSKVTVADPNSLENTQTPWDISLLLDELKMSAKAGGPVWAISPQ